MKIIVNAEKTDYFSTEVELPDEVVDDEGICHWINQNLDSFDWEVSEGCFEFTEYEASDM